MFTVNTARVKQPTFADNVGTNELEHKQRLSEANCEITNRSLSKTVLCTKSLLNKPPLTRKPFESDAIVSARVISGRKSLEK